MLSRALTTRHPPSAGCRELAVLTALLALLGLAALRPSIRGNDGVGNYVYLASLLRGGDLDFADDYRAFDRIKQYPYHFADLPRSSRTGRYSNRYGIGAALLWSPFVAAVRILPAGRPADPNLMALTRPYAWAVGLGTYFWVSLALLLLYKRLRRMHGPLVCGVTLAGLLLATPLGFYALAHGSMSHGAEFFAATLVMLAFESAWHRPSFYKSAVLGAAGGLLALVRIQEGAWLAIVGTALLWRLLRPAAEAAPLRRRVVPAAAHAIIFTIAALAVLLPQIAVWKYLYGSWLSGPAPYLNGSVAAFAPWPRFAVKTLFSERGGVLAWHPLFIPCLAGLIGSLRDKQPPRVLAWVGLAGFTAQLLIVGSWSAWWAGASFGNRYFIGTLPFLALGLAYWLERRPVKSIGWRFALVGMLIFWNGGLLVQYATRMVSRDGAMPWSQVIYQNVIDVPRFLWQRFIGG